MGLRWVFPSDITGWPPRVDPVSGFHVGCFISFHAQEPLMQPLATWQSSKSKLTSYCSDL